MPFDSFFSSANKDYFVKSEKYEELVKPEVARVLSLPKLEQDKYVSALQVKASKHETTMTEKYVLKALQYLWNRKHKAIQRRYFYARQNSLKNRGAEFFGGFNTASR